MKERPGLYETRNTKMKSMIIEICFVDSEKDARLYRQLGPDTVGKAISESILRHAVSEDRPIEPIKTLSEPMHNRPYEYGVVTATSGLYVRDGINGNIIGSLASSVTVHIDYVKDGWYKIYFGDHGVWVYSKYIKLI